MSFQSEKQKLKKISHQRLAVKKARPVGNENSRTFRVLQDGNQLRPQATSGLSTVDSDKKGVKWKNNENHNPCGNKRRDGIFEDTMVMRDKCISDDRTDTNKKVSSTDNASKTLDMMCMEVAPAEYLQALSEKRRIALEDTLKENESLTQENLTLKQELLTLKEENALLQELVDEAKLLAELVQEVTGEED